MIDTLFWTWLTLFIFFMWINVRARSWVFGGVAGFWSILLGLLIAVEGIEIKSGEIQTIVNNTTYMNYTYADVTMPYGDFNEVWGVIFISLGIFLLAYNSWVTKRKNKNE